MKKILIAMAILLVAVPVMAAKVAEVPVTNPTNFVFQAYPGDSDGTDLQYLGYAGLGEDVITAVPGVLQIVPGPNWANFVRVTTPAGAPVAYSIKNVSLVKTTPQIIQCADVFPVKRISQQGTANIRLQWPLMYEVPGTTWTLTILVGTTVPSIIPGDTSGNLPSYVHTIIWKWAVDANINSMENLLALFHELPFGLDEVPLISNEVLYPVLQAKLVAAGIAIEAGDTVTAGDILGDFDMEVMDACIGVSPLFPNPVIGTGIANTAENPACCKLLADTEYVGFQTGSFQPSK
jgi:hypothetical protein